MKTIYNNIFKGGIALTAVAMMASCSDSFLEQDPLSFFEPTATFTTEAGLQAALAKCDRSIKEIYMDGNGNVLPMATNYNMSDLGLYAKTDAGSAFQDNFADNLQPNSWMGNGGDMNAMMRYWNEAYNAIKYANTVISNIDNVAGLDDATRDAYKGRAYFHRAFKYYHLVLQFGNVPLVTEIITVPKQNYRSTNKEAIFKMLVHDMEFAAEHVPAQADMRYIGQVNKEACLMLLAKCALVTGEYDKAIKACDQLINDMGHSLMKTTFGTNVPSGEPQTWTITRNVMWDLMRGDNVCTAANKEMLMPILNFNDENFTQYLTMRAMGVHWSNSVAIMDPHGKMKDKWGEAMTFNYARTNGYYDPQYDWLRVMGRGIGCFRTSYHYNQTIWNYDGQTDWQDLRHNNTVGNWIEMTDIKYNNPNSDCRGMNMQLYATEDYYNDKGEKVVSNGQLLCLDTIRSWYPTPLWKMYILDATAENNRNANQFNGATTGSNGNWYLFRLAETYLIRAEAKFYKGDATGAAADVNEVRARANAKKMFTTVTIGDIMDERARELYLEEWRQAELCRVSWCLAKSGRPDEWGNTYDINTWDKQQGTDLNGGSYWYQRCIRCNIFNRGTIKSNGNDYNYKVDKRNLFWPIPKSAITANNGADLMQNFGYQDRIDNAPMWETWEEAVADERNV